MRGSKTPFFKFPIKGLQFHGFLFHFVNNATHTSLFAKKLEKLAESDIITASCQEKMPGREELNKFSYGEALLRVPTP